MTPAIRGVLLDFGGTLDSPGKHWSTQFAESFAAAGTSLDRRTLDRAFMAVDRALALDPRSATMPLGDYALAYVLGIAARAPEARIDAPRSREVAKHFTDRALDHLRGAAALLGQHRQRYRVAVVSNFTRNLRLIIEDAGLDAVLDGVVCSDVEGVRKPDPAIFRLALDRLGVTAGEAAMVGDSLANDIVPAKRLGLRTIWLRGDHAFTGGDESAADHTVSDLAEAFAILASLSQPEDR